MILYNQDVQMWQQAGLLVLCMIEEQGLGRCSPEEIVNLKRRRLSNLRHNFIATANLQITPRQQDVIIVGFLFSR